MTQSNELIDQLEILIKEYKKQADHFHRKGLTIEKQMRKLHRDLEAANQHCSIYTGRVRSLHTACAELQKPDLPL